MKGNDQELLGNVLAEFSELFGFEKWPIPAFSWRKKSTRPIFFRQKVIPDIFAQSLIFSYLFFGQKDDLPRVFAQKISLNLFKSRPTPYLFLVNMRQIFFSQKSTRLFLLYKNRTTQIYFGENLSHPGILSSRKLTGHVYQLPGPVSQ